MQSARAILHGHLWLVWLHHIFQHYLTYGTIVRKKLLNTKCLSGFSLQFLSKTLVILRIIQQDIIINVHGSSRTDPLFLSDSNGTRIFLTDFKKILKY